MHILAKILEEVELEGCTIGIWGRSKAEEGVVSRSPCDVLAKVMKHSQGTVEKKADTAHAFKLPIAGVKDREGNLCCAIEPVCSLL